MPTGKVKWFDPDRGFGFITGDDGTEAFLRASVLPMDAKSPRPGTRVEYSVADGRKGPQALAVSILAEQPSVLRNRRLKPEAMVPLVEDLIRMLDGASGSLRRGRYPEHSKKIAQVLRAVSDNFDA